MRVKQISVFLENKAGRLSEVTAILAEAGINIRPFGCGHFRFWCAETHCQ